MRTRLCLALIGVITALALTVNAQTNEFVYQGQLQNSGAPANGNFDFEFLLFDQLPAGGTQFGTTLTRSGVQVTNGIFSVKLDFGSVFPGANRFLEIHVRQASVGASFTPLTPRQAVSNTPYSVKALTADTATNATTATSVPVAGSDPAAASAGNVGRLYFNVVAGALKFSDGAAWQSVATASSGGSTANYFQISWTTATNHPCCNWVTIPDTQTNLATTGKPLLINMNISLTGGSHVGCRPIIDGLWAGSYGGLLGGSDPFWQEGLLATGASGGGFRRWNLSRIYPGVPAGNHTFAVQCVTDGGTASTCGSTIGCSWNAIELH